MSSDLAKWVLVVFASKNGRLTEAYVESYDPDAHDGRGDAKFTTDLDKAMKFENQAAAIECWRMPSVVRPLRDDGKPNRPLTALSVTITQVSKL